jgi:hypothetical protein
MQSKEARRDGSGQQHSAAAAGKEALRTSLNDAFNASVEEAFEAIEQEDQKHKEERARLLAQAQTAAVKIKSDAATEVEEMKSDAAKEVEEMKSQAEGGPHGARARESSHGEYTHFSEKEDSSQRPRGAPL